MKVLGGISGIFLLSLAVTFQVEDVSSAKILMVTFMSTKSHKITYEPLLRQLARRGHEVTILSPIISKNETNFKNIAMVDMDTFFTDIPNMFDMKLNMPPWLAHISNPFLLFGGHIKNLCEASYRLPQIQDVLHQKWDLVFHTPFMNDCVWGLIHKINAPVVVFQQTEIFTSVSDAMGTPSPPSFVSSLIVGYMDRMNFRERLWNLVKGVLDWAVNEWYYYPMMTNVYREFFNDPNMPSVKEILKNTSIVLANSNICFAKPRPYMPDIIEVGGLSLNPAKPVPKDLEEFLSGSPDGFILFSMGSAIKASTMPEKYRKIFVNTFAKLKQRVIWKWETETMPDLPPNVKLSKWLPQQDVLGHKAIRLFITHGGMGGTAEALYHGVPLLGIPMMGDQEANMIKAENYGFAYKVDFNTLTEEIFLDGINTVLADPKYRENVQKLSRIFLDQPTKPMDRAIYWVEYVLRHQGAPHLRSAARDLNYIQYFSLDVLAVLVVIALVSLKINIMIFRAIWRRCFGSKKSINVDKKKKDK